MLRPLEASWPVEERSLIKGTIILAVLALSAWAGRAASLRLVLGLLAMAGLLLLLRKPQWGLVALIAASLVVPFEIGTGTQSTVNISQLLVAAMLAVWVLGMFRRGSVGLAPNRVNLPWVFFLLAAMLALLTGNAFWNPLVVTKENFLFVQLAQLAIYALSAGAFWLTANLVTEERWLRTMTFTFLGLGALYIGGRLVPRLGTVIVGRYAGGAAGSLFWVWLVALAWGQALFNRGLNRGVRLALGALVMATFYVGWFQTRDWVSGWGPPLAALLVVTLLWSPRLGTMFAIGTAVLVYLFYPYFYNNVVVRAMETGSDLRLVAWQGVSQLVGSRWLIGLGLASYWHYWRGLIGYWAFSPTNVVFNPQVNTHNNYMDFYAQMGVIGLAAFLWLAAEIGRLGWRLRGRAKGDFARGYLNGALGGFVGMLAAGMLGDWFLPFVYNGGMTKFRSSVIGWLFLGGLVALESMARARGEEA
jgi:hypothetical protein